MRVYCQCGHKANVGKISQLAPGEVRLACCCSDPYCGHSFIMSVSFKHSISLPLQSDKECAEMVSIQGNRIYCSCGERAVIQKTNRLSLSVADIYCEGRCGHRFVLSQTFEHSLSPSAQSVDELTLALTKMLSPEQRRALQEQLSRV